MLEIELVRVSFLECHTTNLLQYGQIVAHGLNTQAFLDYNELLKLPDELLVKLAKGKVGNLEPVTDELTKTAAGIDIGRWSAMGYIYTDTGFDFLDVSVKEGQQGHLYVLAALEYILDRSRIEIGLTLHERVKGCVHRQQQFLDFCIDLHCLPALSIQTAFTGIPQLGSAGKFATELRHRAVHGYSSHYRGFARLVQSAPFEVEQHLEFFYFHTLIFLGAKLLAI